MLYSCFNIAVFSCFTANNDSDYSTRLFAFFLLKNLTDLGAQEHEKIFGDILEYYGKHWDNVMCLITDNCNSNKTLLNRCRKPPIGCATHRFNLAVQDIHDSYMYILGKVDRLVVKLRSLIIRTKPRKLTPLRPKTRKITRWSSCYKPHCIFLMSMRYIYSE